MVGFDQLANKNGRVTQWYECHPDAMEVGSSILPSPTKQKACRVWLDNRFPYKENQSGSIPETGTKTKNRSDNLMIDETDLEEMVESCFLYGSLMNRLAPYYLEDNPGLWEVLDFQKLHKERDEAEEKIKRLCRKILEIPATL